MGAPASVDLPRGEPGCCDRSVRLTLALLAVLLAVAVSCPLPPVYACESTADCGVGTRCEVGACVPVRDDAGEGEGEGEGEPDVHLAFSKPLGPQSFSP